MIHETHDATLINSVVNKPDILAQFALRTSIDALDLTELAERPDYRIVTNGLDAFMIAEEKSPVIYMCHSVFDHTCRGRAAVEQGKQIIAWMWDNTDALILYGITPAENRAARLFNKWIGFTSDGVRDFIGEHSTYQAEFFHITRPTATPD